MAHSIDAMIDNLDLSVFKIESETSPDDRRSLLAVQKAVRSWKPGYTYLECGSHLGGSLMPHLLDPRCRLALSVDKRPAYQPDERGMSFHYASNSTQRMLDVLSRHVTANDIAKLRTYDMDASALIAAQIDAQPDLVFIDAEHTVDAVFRDFTSIYPMCGASTVYAFHDANLIFSGLQNIESFLRYLKVDFASYILRDSVFVVASGEARACIQPLGSAFPIDKQTYAASSQLGLMRAHHDFLEAQSRQPAPAPRPQSRNSPCHCGSGKRYKHCHGR